MLQAILSRVSCFRQRVFGLFRRTDPLSVDSAERRERWNQVIAEHQKPLDREKTTSTASTGKT